MTISRSKFEPCRQSFCRSLLLAVFVVLTSSSSASASNDVRLRAVLSQNGVWGKVTFKQVSPKFDFYEIIIKWILFTVRFAYIYHFTNELA